MPIKPTESHVLSVFYIAVFLKNMTLIISAVITYETNIPAIIPNSSKGGTTNPRSLANGIKGSPTVMTRPEILNPINNLPGLLFNNDLWVRTTNKINSSVQIDSINQPV